MLTNGVDLEYFRTKSNQKTVELRQSFGNFVFGYIGNFAKYQGVENSIKAAERY